MLFPKKYNKKGLKKTKANNAKAVSVGAEDITALVIPQAIKPKMPKSPSHKFSLLTFITYPKLGKKIRSYLFKVRQLCHPKSKVQTKAEATAPANAQDSDPAQAPKGAQVPMKVQ